MSLVLAILLGFAPVAHIPVHHHKPPFHCITKGKHHPEICVPKFPKK